MARKRQWDDWRCYRCRVWQASYEPRLAHVTPAGISISVCRACALVAGHTA